MSNRVKRRASQLRNGTLVTKSNTDGVKVHYDADADACAFCERPATWWNLALPLTGPGHATAVSDRTLSAATCRIHRGRSYPEVFLFTYRPLADGPYTPEQQCAAFGCTVDHEDES